MPWRVDYRRLVLDLLRAGLIVAVAGFGAMIVHNVTEMLTGIAYHSASETWPSCPAPMDGRMFAHPELCRNLAVSKAQVQKFATAGEPSR